MRNRINKNLVGTSSDSETKKRYADRNKTKRVIYLMSVYGVKKQITFDEYKRLKDAGITVEMKEI